MSGRRDVIANPRSVHGKSVDRFETAVMELEKFLKKVLTPSAAEKPQTSSSNNYGPVH